MNLIGGSTIRTRNAMWLICLMVIPYVLSMILWIARRTQYCMLQSYLFDRRMLSGRFGAREGLAPVNEVAVTDPLDHTISTVYDAEDRVLAQRGTTYPGSGKYKGSEITTNSASTWMRRRPRACAPGSMPGSRRTPSAPRSAWRTVPGTCRPALRANGWQEGQEPVNMSK